MGHPRVVMSHRSAWILRCNDYLDGFVSNSMTLGGCFAELKVRLSGGRHVGWSTPPGGAVFYWDAFGVAGLVGALAGTANAADGSAPATTGVSDTLFRADGVPAAGVVLISWPAFTTSDAKPVAEGTKSVKLGNGG